MLLTSGTVIDFELGEAGVVGGANNDLVLVGGNLTLDGILNVAGFGPGYGAGYYRLFNYGGSLTDNGLALGTIEGGLQPACSPTLQGQVNLRLGGAQRIQYWDGGDLNGASKRSDWGRCRRDWDAAGTNWTTPLGYAVNDAWRANRIFQGAAGGIVTIAARRPSKSSASAPAATISWRPRAAGRSRPAAASLGDRCG
jgi:fibronectin-binding autotransporter adhesin